MSPALRRIRDIFWVGAGTGAAALGTLVGVRVLTQYVSPANYGVISLALGMSTLVSNLVSAPLTQAAIHYYPLYSSDAGIFALRDALVRCFRKCLPWILVAAVLGGIWYSGFGGGHALTVVLLLLLFAAECVRTVNLSMLNAARKHRQYNIWAAIDAWLRPLVATAVVLTVGSSADAVLASYVLVAFALVAVFSRGTWPKGVARERETAQAQRLDLTLWAYAMPLIPLGLLGWASSLGDRYIIGATLGVHDAGLYAAVYGLSYNPFMIVNGGAEQALRPVFQTAVSQGNHTHARGVLRLWLLSVGLACACGVAIFALGHRLIAHYLLSAQFREVSYLMPWIALGYAIRCISYVFERICYGYGRTWRVLVIQGCAAGSALVITPIAILNFGLLGAACAVPVCFTVQALVAIVLARRTMREAIQGETPEQGVPVLRPATP
jgi:O-antigen/teichoic acid export membrane protein